MEQGLIGFENEPMGRDGMLPYTPSSQSAGRFCEVNLGQGLSTHQPDWEGLRIDMAIYPTLNPLVNGEDLQIPAGKKNAYLYKAPLRNKSTKSTWKMGLVSC
ncbi:hypothetical protein VTK56DRAFT_6679 [Thermocarpiscus australiensis]